MFLKFSFFCSISKISFFVSSHKTASGYLNISLITSNDSFKHLSEAAKYFDSLSSTMSLIMRRKYSNLLCICTLYDSKLKIEKAAARAISAANVWTNELKNQNQASLSIVNS